MAHKLIHNCPVCGGGLHVVRLRCPSCGTQIEGDFETEQLLRLSEQQRSFVLSFVRSRGNIREMEKELGLSYPTVRARLDDIIRALDDGKPAPRTRQAPTRKQVLEMLSAGEISQDEAMEMISALQK